MLTVDKIKLLRETEDHVEFKEASGGNYSYNGGGKPEPAKRRRCILGYVIALSNEGGGHLIFGVNDKYPHRIVGSSQNINAIGELESRIYNDTGIRIEIYELFEQEKRILVIEIPCRPAGKVYKFEDVPLMRVGEELKPMSDEQYLKILQEQEPDFSEKICEQATMDDLDNRAIQIMKEKYSIKHDNPQFATLDNKQVLSDLNLIKENNITNAAVLLLGKREFIQQVIPQSMVRLELRKSDSIIEFSNRVDFIDPYFILLEDLWKLINLRNDSIKIHEGPYIFDIRYFNALVVREAVNNAFAHRDYRRTSEIVIKQYDVRLDIISPGGFPSGVNISNLITVASTPRNRLLTDILQKTGIVERSGQGIDKIYLNMLSEGKKEPDYSYSDDFQVELRLSGMVEDKAFAMFIQSSQEDEPEEDRLNVFEIIELNKIKQNVNREDLNTTLLPQLLSKGYIEKHGKTKGTFYTLSKDYYEITGEAGKYSRLTGWSDEQAFYIILQHLSKFEQASMKDFVDLFQGKLSRMQVRTVVEKLVENKGLKREGEAKATRYSVGENYLKTMEMISKAIDIGMKEMSKENPIDDKKQARK